MIKRYGDWMQTFSGVAYWPMDPRVSEVRIEDIAHHLSMICRFGGAVSRFYSVAEHSVLVSKCVPKAWALQGLLHDATEAYVGDVVRPLKRNLPRYEEVERLNWLCIAEAFSLPIEMHESVKHADNTVLLAERNALLGPQPIPWGWDKNYVPADVEILCMTPEEAKSAFLARFNQLYQIH